jgi:phosphoglycolate phosphatase
MKTLGIIFDLDGTLVHTIEDLADSANTLFKSHGYPAISEKDFIQWIGNGATKFIEQGIGSVIDKNKLSGYVEEFKAIYADNLANKSKLYEGIADMLDELNKLEIKIAILSNKPHLHTLRVTDHYLKNWTFETILGQRDEVPRKPDPTSALEISETMGVDPGNILFIGDSAGDINTALAAGMIPVWVSWGYGSPELDLKNLAINLDHPDEVLGLLN